MIDRGIAHPWPTAVLQAVARFKQGDLVVRPPLFYAAVARYGIWGLTPAVTDRSTDAEILELDPTSDGPPYGLITTQTCDLFEQRPQPRQPWVQVALVYQWDDLGSSQKRQVERFEIGHPVKLTGPALPAGFWVADLRIEVPLVKSWLVGHDPIDGFADEAEYLRLAARLAGRRLRPALDNVMSEQVVGTLRQAFSRLSPARKSQLLDQVEQLRLFVTGDRLSPQAAQLVVITAENPAPPLRQWFDAWWAGVQQSTEAAGVALVANRYTTMDQLTAREYEHSVALDFSYLSPDD